MDRAKRLFLVALASLLSSMGFSQRRSTTASLSLLSQADGLLTVSTLGTKARPGAKLESWLILWGDGDETPGSGAPPSTLSHQYRTFGAYRITLAVWDTRGGHDEASLMGAIVYTTPVSGGGETCTVTVAPTVAAIQSAHDAASDGDVICLQAGNETWTSKVTVTKAVTIKGAGVGQTIITNNNTTDAGRLFDVALVAAKTTRIAHIEFAATTAGNNGQGVINVQGSSDQDGSRFRLDHCTLNDFGGDNVSAYGFWFDGVLGVIDHCTFNIDDTNHIPIEVQHENWAGSEYGDGAWNEGNQYGTDQFLFVEDCAYNGTGGTETFGGVFVDALNGARWVVRNCTIVNAQMGPHGTESGGRQRSGRAFEVYDNAFSGMFPAGIPVHNRGGSCLIHGNTFASVTIPTVSFVLEYKRLSGAFAPWGVADGTNVWDKNIAGGPFDSGTATGGGDGSLTDTGKSWTTNQWVGYSVKLTSGCTQGVSENSCGAVIISNTSTTLTTRYETYAPGPFSPAAGNTYQIWKVDEGLDMPGKGEGSLLSGASPSVPGGWYDQVDDPCYEWDNTGDGSVGSIVWDPQQCPNQMRSGEHYFTATSKPGYTPYAYPHPLVT